jgi:predicted secreted Zn-dependent protease
MKLEEIPCPFVYAKGKRCPGHVSAIEAFKADISWVFRDGKWGFNVGQPRSHYHVYCSEKGSHARPGSEDALKFYWNELTAEIKAVLAATKHNVDVEKVD